MDRKVTAVLALVTLLSSNPEEGRSHDTESRGHHRRRLRCCRSGAAFDPIQLQHLLFLIDLTVSDRSGGRSSDSSHATTVPSTAPSTA